MFDIILLLLLAFAAYTWLAHKWDWKAAISAVLAAAAAGWEIVYPVVKGMF